MKEIHWTGLEVGDVVADCAWEPIRTVFRVSKIIDNSLHMEKISGPEGYTSYDGKHYGFHMTPNHHWYLVAKAEPFKPGKVIKKYDMTE